MSLRAELRRALNTLVGSAEVSDNEWVPIPCTCTNPDGSKTKHGPHWVTLRRLRKGGDLHGKVQLDESFEGLG